MKRTSLNYWTDALAFAGFAFLTTTGILLRYQLPAGSGRVDVLGEGRRALEKPISLLWGLTRHEWGDVHYYVALGLMAVLAMHLVLHWKWIVCVTRGKPAEGSGYRWGLGVLGLVAVLLLAMAPLLAPSIEVPRSELHNEGVAESQVDGDEDTIRGEMTISEVEQVSGVPASYILQQLGLPETTSPDARLGRLKRTHGLTMEDVRRIIAKYEAE